MDRIIKKQIETYRPNFLEHGISPKGTFQNDLITQEERHLELLNPLFKHKSTHFSICDVGSGLCDLHGLLNKLNIAHDYTGIEIVDEMVEASKKLWPRANVVNADILDPSFKETFDFVVLSGTFNIPGSIPINEWESFVFKMIKAMYDHCKIGISFNALTTYSTFRDGHLFYLSPEKVFSFIQSQLSRFCCLNTSYPLYEVTYTVFRPENLKEQFPQPAFQKYFKK